MQFLYQHKNMSAAHVLCIVLKYILWRDKGVSSLLDRVPPLIPVFDFRDSAR